MFGTYCPRDKGRDIQEVKRERERGREIKGKNSIVVYVNRLYNNDFRLAIRNVTTGGRPQTI